MTCSGVYHVKVPGIFSKQKVHSFVKNTLQMCCGVINFDMNFPLMKFSMAVAALVIKLDSFTNLYSDS